MTVADVAPASAADAPRDRVRRRNRHYHRYPLMVWLIPAAAVYIVVTVVPSLRGVVYAFTDWNGLSADYDFVGLKNFRSVFKDPLTLAATVQTLFYAVVVTIAETVLGLLLALGLTSGIRTRNLLRVVLFMPFVVMPIVIAFLWKYIYTPSGPLDQLVTAFGLPAPDWLGSPTVARWSVVVAIVWQLLGLSIVIFIAALISMPQDVIEAAHVDGASAVQRFWHITLPLVRPAVTIVVVLSMLTCFKLFDQVWVLTQGGPVNSTQTLTTAMYQKAFTFGQFGQASVLAVLITLLGLVASLAQVRVQRRRRVSP